MDWHSALVGFRAYLQIERSLSPHSVEAYLHDVQLMRDFLVNAGRERSPQEVRQTDIEDLLVYLNALGLGSGTQSRVLSGLRQFYKYLMLEDLAEVSPLELIEGPRLGRKLPTVLSYEEIRSMIEAIDLSHPQGQRNRAIIETLYACGLRVSELTGLQLSQIFWDEEYVRVIGKNNKERLVPIGEHALKYIGLYLEGDRNRRLNIDPAHTDIVFLNRRGKKMSRVMIFNIVRSAAKRAGIEKTVSPHTFRHSFATHLVEGGANLRAVQEMLGHASITTTEIYAHLDTTFLRETIMTFHPRNR